MTGRTLRAALAFNVVITCSFLTGGFYPASASGGGEKAGTEAGVHQASQNEPTQADKALLEAIMRRQKELDAREEELREREERLLALRSEVEGKVADLVRLQSKVEEAAKKIDAARDDRVRKLVKIYESMAPEDAAPRIEKLSERDAVIILSTMREKNAAKILGLVSAGKSAKLSAMMKVLSN